MANISYPEAAISEPWQILGLRLRPLSLGHYLLMERFNVAFVHKDECDATIEDLILGVLICSMRYQEFLDMIEEGDFHSEIEAWGKQAGEFNIPDKVALFQRYIKAGTRQPIVIFEEEGRPSGAHWAQCLMTSLMGQLGYTREEALNIPLVQAITDFYKNAENIGLITIATDEMAEALMEQEKADATRN